MLNPGAGVDDAATGDGAVAVDDAYLEYAGDFYSLVIGENNVTSPLEDRTSSLDIPFLERSSIINAYGYGRAAGVALGPHPDVLTYQGFANRKLSNYDVAISYYSAALKLDPEHRGANEYLGEYYVETGQLAKADAQLVKLERICKFGCEEAEELRRWIGGAKS